MYTKCGCIDEAENVFSQMQGRNVISWTNMISAYVQSNKAEEARQLYRQMLVKGVDPDKVACISILSACTNSAALLEDGKLIHAQISACRLSENVTVANALNLVSWNTMITGCVQNDWHVKALHLFQQMHQEGIFLDRISFTSTLTACCSVKLFGDGKFIHACIIDSHLAQDAMVNTALINMYGKCLHLEDAIHVFEEISEKDIVSWNAMIAVCVHNEHAIDAIEFFNEMQLQGLTPDRITFIGVLDACANVAALNIGRQVHATLDIAYDSDVAIVNALLNMYGKCGSLSDAHKTFRKMQGHDLLTWNTMITAYSQHGEANEVLQLLMKMHHEGVKPNNVTFISLLSAFGRAGLNTEGFFCLVCLSELYSIAPMLEHYGCITDQFGRLGKLDEAEECIIAMPFQANAMTWMTLLGACRVHGDEERGRRAAQHAFELDQQISGAYVMLANIFAESAR